MSRPETCAPSPLTRRRLAAGALALSVAGVLTRPGVALADDRQTLITNSRRALDQLLAQDARARALSPRARAVLVFPSVIKAGFVFGGARGAGVLFVRGRPEGFFSLTGGSWGLQIGGQDFAYALFFMTPNSLRYLRDAKGFSGGSLPSLVVMNKGVAGNIDTTTALHEVYAFPFNQRGLMANLTLEGTHIAPINPPH
jgi:lipid-binding SYLF domain-containing protein